jgi:hypothetical protein
MSGIRHDGCFDEAALAAMIVAYDLTCNSLSCDATPAARETVGKRIIEAARQGERDPNVLRQGALNAIGGKETSNMLAV